MDQDNTLEPIEEEIVNELDNNVETEAQDNAVEDTAIEPYSSQL